MLKKLSRKLLILAGLILTAANLFATPDSIIDVNATASSAYQATLTWTTPNPNDSTSAPSGYIIKYSTTEIDSVDNVNGANCVGFYSVFTSTYNYTWGSLSTTGNAQTATLTGLYPYPGIAWNFAVVAVDKYSVAGNWLGQSDGTPGTYNTGSYVLVYSTTPVAVTGLNSDYGNTYINISWQANPEPDIRDYRIECSSWSSIAGFSEIANISTTTAASTGATYQNSGLVNGNTYYYRMRAQNTYAVNSGYGNYCLPQSTRPWINLGTPSLNLTYSQTISTTSINWAWNNLPGSTSGYSIIDANSGATLYQSTTPSDTYWIQNNLTPNATSAIILQGFNGYVLANSLSLSHRTFAIPPVNVSTSTLSSRSANIQWSHGANTPDTAYSIRRSSSIPLWQDSVSLGNVPAGTTYYYDAGLAEGTTFSYDIRGINGEGIPSASYAELTFTTMRIPPGIPNLYGTPLSGPGTIDGEVNLEWATSRDDGMDTNTPYSASYLIKWSTASIYSDGDFAAIPPSASKLVSGVAAGAMANTITGLYPGTTFYFAIKALDADNNYSIMSDTINIVPLDLPPGVPGSVSAVVISSVSIKVSWTKPTITANAYDDIAQYVIYRATYSFSGFQAGVSSTTVSIPTTYYIDAGVNQKTTYYYHLSALDLGNATGYFTGFVSTVYESALSPIASIYVPDTIAPAAISQITALTGVVKGEIGLSWTCPGDDGSIGNIINGQFKVDYSTDVLKSFTTSSFQIFASTSVSPGDQNSISITGLNSGSTYYFRIWTADPIGNWSNLSSGATAWAQYDIVPPSSITDLVAAPSWRSAALSWTSPGQNGDFGVFSGTYEIRTSNLGPINDITTWNAATGFPSVMVSTTAAPGSLQTAVVPGLTNGATYYFAVRATHNYAGPSAVYTVSPSASPFDHLPSTFSLASPSYNDLPSTATPVNFVWNASSDADAGDTLGYTIYYSTDSSFQAAVSSDPVGIHNNDSIELSAYNNMTVYWYVKAIDADNNYTPSTTLAAPTTSYSRVRVWTTKTQPQAFSLSSPANAYNSPVSTPTLNWTASVDAAPWDVISYQVDLSTSQNFSTYISSQSIPTTSYITPLAHPLQNNTTYWWRVWADDGVFKIMSNTTGYFRVSAAPVAPFAFSLSTPIQNAILSTTTVSFSWAPTYTTDPDSSIKYEITWSTHSDFLSSVTTITGLTQTTTTYPNFADHSIYYWYVTAVSTPSGLRTQSTETTKFYVDTYQILPATFSLIQPGYGVVISTTLTPLFTWATTTVPNPEDEIRYTCHIFQRPDLTGPDVGGATGTDNFFVPISNLVDQTTYYWYVQAMGYEGNPWYQIPQSVDTGTLSAVSYFVISMVSHPPQNFALTSPSNGAVLKTKKPLFKWGTALDTDVSAYVTYSLLVSTSPDFSSVSLNVTGLTDTQYQVTSALTENKTYYWKVTAFSSRNTPSTPCTANFSFQIPILTVPQTPMGLQGTVSPDKLKFTISWSPVAKNSDGTSIDDLAGYNIYRGSEQMMMFFASVPPGTNQWTDGSMQGVEYYYRVTAVNSSGIENTPEDSPLLDSLSLGTLTYMSGDKSLIINVPAQVAQYMIAQNNPYAKDLRIKFEHNPSAETDTILSSYNIDMLTADGVGMDKFNFEQPLTASFGYGSTTYAGKRLAIARKTVPASSLGELNIYWNNSIEYMRVGGTPNTATQQVAIKVVKTGEYQLRRVSRASVFSVASVYPPKVFTPNIPPYETIIFYVDNPQGDKVTGKVFNLRGESIADLSADGDATATSVILSWNGKNSNGEYVTKGVYIYQLKGSGKVLNGTIMVAR